MAGDTWAGPLAIFAAMAVGAVLIALAATNLIFLCHQGLEWLTRACQGMSEATSEETGSEMLPIIWDREMDAVAMLTPGSDLPRADDGGASGWR
ncbi:hypothetical protein [Singulisphaera sp. PoT]|uniref:hypothetical protein n=1 Tax=Singulisphaera sp. PoT TaxID=3411797 RepID=UPI003BF4707C